MKKFHFPKNFSKKLRKNLYIQMEKTGLSYLHKSLGGLFI